MSTFTVITPMEDGNGRRWLDFKPGHFDRDKLPRKHRKPEPEGLFPVADVVETWQTRTPKREAQMDGQGELFNQAAL